jgi:hypothetical protein
MSSAWTPSVALSNAQTYAATAIISTAFIAAYTMPVALAVSKRNFANAFFSVANICLFVCYLTASKTEAVINVVEPSAAASKIAISVIRCEIATATAWETYLDSSAKLFSVSA